MSVQDTIERNMVFSASRERVWAALTDPDKITKWFGTRAEFKSLTVGEAIMFGWDDDYNPGRIVEVDPPRRFAYRWSSFHVTEADKDKPMDELMTTLVTFTLEEVPEGTRLTLVESGFASLPAHVRKSQLGENITGWDGELKQLADYLESESAS